MSFAKSIRLMGTMLLLVLSGLLASCEEPRVYGSVGYSSYSGGYGGGFGTSISVGGRIY